MNHSFVLTYSSLIYLRGRGEQVVRTNDRLALLSDVFNAWIFSIRPHRGLPHRSLL